MTPFQQVVVSALAAHLKRGDVDPSYRVVWEYAQLATGYDFSAVTELVIDVHDQLLEQQGPNLRLDDEFKVLRNQDERARIDHGGLFVPPDDVFWVQFKINAVLMAVLLAKNPERSSHDVFATFARHEHSTEMLIAGIFVDWDEQNVILRPDVRFKKKNRPEDQQKAQLMAQLAVAAIVTLNSPYGIERETPPVHKGQARDLRRRGIELKPHHIIRLSRKPPPDHAMRGEGSGKAFHFVRSHRRQYQSGNTTIVRAHFRGDPRLGVHRQASYEVRP